VTTIGAGATNAAAGPVVLSTWSFGRRANAVAWPVLEAVGDALDALEAGCRAVEADPDIDSVGLGGLPDAAGEVTLDACVMRSPREVGAVACVRGQPHPCSIARRLMETSGYVLLAGEGAEAFAVEQGFPPVDLRTDAARAEWERWRDDPNRAFSPRFRGWLPPRNVEERQGVGSRIRAADGEQPDRPDDTIGLLALDGAGRLAGICSTSGMAFKRPGRVGDSPIVGHALYVHPDHGAAVATGSGELVMRTCSAFLAVEALRRGATPLEAGQEAVRRVREEIHLDEEHQVAVLVLTPDGRWNAAALRPGYRTAVTDATRSALVASDWVLLPDDDDPIEDDASLL